MEYLRETVIRDILDLKKEIDKEEVFDKRFKNGNDYYTSIAKRSKDLVMTFPVLCSNTLDPRTATMISKAIERKCTTMMQLIVSANTITDVTTAQDFISKFHKNINMNGLSVDDYVKLSDQIYTDITGFAEGAYINEGIKKVTVDCRNAMNERFFADSINESSLQNFTIMNIKGETVVSEANNSNIEDEKNKSVIAKNRSDVLKNQQEEFKRRLLDNDAKKCNELVPSLLIIKYITVSEKTKEPVANNAVIGIKARLIPVDSFEIIDKVFVKSNDKQTLLKLIKATTREISFFKDFVFAIDKAKVDALANSRRGSVNRIWKTLEVRATKSRIKRALRTSNDATAITSLVVSQEEANFLKKNYNIDLENVAVARGMLEAYNLLSIIIVDESIEVAKFLFDGDDSYEMLSFNNLERESGDGMYKKVITLMSKMK